MVYITAVHLEAGSGHEHITRVRWSNPADGATGDSARGDMITWIKDQHGVAKVADARGSVDVGVVEARPPYLRTHADGRWTDNLLALPRY
jgi:hypothetical protein